jgi:hypothetical protein
MMGCELLFQARAGRQGAWGKPVMVPLLMLDHIGAKGGQGRGGFVRVLRSKDR